MHESFKVAYQEMARNHPCLGAAVNMPNIKWWRTAVHNSFLKAGYNYDSETLEKIFLRVYKTFGSSVPYLSLGDAKPTLRWIRKQSVMVGILSNVEHRYLHVILPSLGLHQLYNDFKNPSAPAFIIASEVPVVHSDRDLRDPFVVEESDGRDQSGTLAYFRASRE